MYVHLPVYVYFACVRASAVWSHLTLDMHLRASALTPCLVLVREDFLFSGQVRPSAAAAGRRAGPVLAPLRAAGPAATHNKGPMTKEEFLRPPGPAFNQVVVERPGRPSPRPILVTVERHQSRPCGPCGITLRVSLDLWRSPVRIGHYEGRPSE